MTRFEVLRRLCERQADRAKADLSRQEAVLADLNRRRDASADMAAWLAPGSPWRDGALRQRAGLEAAIVDVASRCEASRAQFRLLAMRQIAVARLVGRHEAGAHRAARSRSLLDAIEQGMAARLQAQASRQDRDTG